MLKQPLLKEDDGDSIVLPKFSLGAEVSWGLSFDSTFLLNRRQKRHIN